MTSEVTLAQCPIGLFWAGDELCLKTEYGNNEGRIDAYIVSTGEFFWGSHPQTIPNQRMQMVRPVPEEALARLTAQSGEGRSGAGDDVSLESWADIREKPDAIVACGDRWKAIAAKIRCGVHGFNDGKSASFVTPDGNVIEIGPKFRAVIAALSAPQGEVERLRAENERLTRAVGSGMLNDLLTPDESDEFVKFIQFLRGQRNAALAQPEAGGER